MPAGLVDGLLAYRTKLDWMWTNPPRGDLRVEELWAVTEESESSLWRFCLEHDLMTRVTAQLAPRGRGVPAPAGQSPRLGADPE